MFCQCAPPWLPLYTLFELKQSIKKILLIVVESFGPTLALFDLFCFQHYEVIGIQKLIGSYKKVLLIGKTNYFGS